MMKTMISLCILGLLPAALGSACPNSCNGHGSCSTSNKCECYRNWMAADCSQRVCPFGRAFVDSPKGDLDGDLKLSPSRSFSSEQNFLVESIDLVMGGVSELYNWQYGYARQNTTAVWNEAHFYAECSGKGICNRNTGQCQCFPGYEGSGCIRQSCPSRCSGHGRCLSISESALTPKYSAWDKHKTQMCKCDPGYEGPDCSLRSCKRGADPVKYAHYVTNSVQGVIFKANQGTSRTIYDNIYFTLTLNDEFGDKWTTNLLTIPYAAAGFPNNTVLMSIVENVNKSLSANAGISKPYVWGMQNGNVYPSAANNVDSKGKNVYVDSQKFRLDGAINTTFGPVCGAGKKGLCLFIQNENEGIQSAIEVSYWFNFATRPANVKEQITTGKTIGFMNVSSVATSDTVSTDIELVNVVDVQPTRVWLKKDGDVVKTFLPTQSTLLDVCSARGLCDYATGLCGCFAGYTGPACNEPNSIAYSY